MNSIKSPKPSTSTASVADASELIPRIKQSNFPKIIFGGSSTSKTTVVEKNSPRTDTPKTGKARSTIVTQAANNTEAENKTARSTSAAQTERNTETDNPLEKEIWVSRVDPAYVYKKKQHPTWSPQR